SPSGAGTWTTISSATGSPFTAAWDTTGNSDGLYDLRVLVADGAGNTAASSIASAIRVDNTAPTTTLADPGANVRGTVAIDAAPADAGSGVASVKLQTAPSGSGTWS